MIDHTVARVNETNMDCLHWQYGVLCETPFARLRLATTMSSKKDALAAQSYPYPSAESHLNKYTDVAEWWTPVTSEYALRALTMKMAPSFFADLWHAASDLGDDGVKQIAFVNYVHSMMHGGQEVRLCVRRVGSNETEDQPAYHDVVWRVESYQFQGTDPAECERAIQELAVDYWYPVVRPLKCIHSVAKLEMSDGKKVALVRMATSVSAQEIDDRAATECASWVSGGFGASAYNTTWSWCPTVRRVMRSVCCVVALVIQIQRRVSRCLSRTFLSTLIAPVDHGLWCVTPPLEWSMAVVDDHCDYRHVSSFWMHPEKARICVCVCVLNCTASSPLAVSPACYSSVFVGYDCLWASRLRISRSIALASSFSGPCTSNRRLQNTAASVNRPSCLK